METNITVLIPNVDLDKFHKVQQMISKELGMNISGDSGTQSKDGFTVKYEFFESARQVELTCTEKPWYIPDSLVRHRLEEVANG